MANITSSELSEWQEFYELEPYGEIQQDYRAGLLAMLMYNAWRGPEDAAKPIDFFYASLKSNEAMEGDEIIRHVKHVMQETEMKLADAEKRRANG